MLELRAVRASQNLPSFMAKPESDVMKVELCLENVSSSKDRLRLMRLRYGVVIPRLKSRASDAITFPVKYLSCCLLAQQQTRCPNKTLSLSTGSVMGISVIQAAELSGSRVPT